PVATRHEHAAVAKQRRGGKISRGVESAGDGGEGAGHGVINLRAPGSSGNKGFAVFHADHRVGKFESSPMHVGRGGEPACARVVEFGAQVGAVPVAVVGATQHEHFSAR